MSALVDRLVENLPLLTRAQVIEEAEHDPAFWTYFASLVAQPLPERAVDVDMTKALLNELDLGRFPEMRGKWPMLRAHIRMAVRLAAENAPRGAAQVAGLMDMAGFAGGLGYWEAIGTAVSAIGTAASTAYSLYLKKKLEAARKAAEKKAREREAAALRAEQAALAKAQAGAMPGAPGGYPGAPSGGLPSWAMWAILGVLGLVVAGVGYKLARR